MTVEEAIDYFKRSYASGNTDDERQHNEVLDMAIKALEQKTCDDCISRQAVHDLIAELLSDYLHDEDREKIEKLDVKIEDLEPVTPKEKTGHWIEGGFDFNYWICSKCKYQPNNDYYKPSYKYCPNCGARMVDPQESEVDNG